MLRPPICSSPTDGRTDSFSLHSFLLQKCLHSGGLQLPSPPLGLKSYLRPRGEEVFDWVIFLTSFPSMTLTHPLFSIAPLAVAPLLTSPLLLLLLLFLAPGRCSRTLVLTTYQFFYLSLSLRSFAPMSALLP